MGVRRAIILFADIIGCSEISNNCSIKEYDEIINEYHEIAVKTRDLIFPRTEYSVEEIESSIKGDETCLILHSGKDIQEDYFSTFNEEKDKVIQDIKKSILFAFGLKLMWLISKYNRERIKCWLVPRDIGIGINIGPVMFSVHPATGREKSSEGFSINLAKRIEGVSREGVHSKVFVCKEFKYMCEESRVPIVLDKEKIFELKGITTPPYLHEIKDIIDSKIVTDSPIMKELQALPKEDIELYLKTAMINEQEFWLRKLVGYVLLASKDKRALNLLKKEDVVNNLLERGNAYYYLSDFDEAISNFQKILEIDKKSYPALHNLGVIYRHKGQLDRALEYFEKALIINPRVEEAYGSAGMIYREKGDLDKSLTYFYKALKLNPKSEQALRSIGITYHKKGESAKAIEYLKKALEINPKSEESYGNIGITYYKVGEFDKAMEYFKKALEINPKSEESYGNIGTIYFEKGDLDEALKYSNKILEININNAEAYRLMAEIYREKGELDKALEFSIKAFAINPKSEDICDVLGVSYRAKGNIVEALKYFQKALEINPQNDQSYAAIGETYCEEGDFGKALEYAKKALEINSRSERAYGLLGMIYLKTHDFDKAFESFQKALKINPKSGLANYNLACAFCLKKDIKEAYRLLKKAIEINRRYKKLAAKDPDFESIRDTEEFKMLTLG